MYKVKKVFCAFLILLVMPLLISPSMTNVSRGQPIPEIYVEPKEVKDFQPDESFDINITVKNVIDLQGWEFHLSFDPTVLQVDNVTEGPFLKDIATTIAFWDMDNYAGTVSGVCGFVPLKAPYEGAVGTGVLATATFNVTAVGRTNIHFTETKLSKSVDNPTPPPTYLPAPIEHTRVDGLFSNLHNIALTNVAANLTEVNLGESVSIDVTVNNEGDFTENFNITTYWKIGSTCEKIETKSVANLEGGTTTNLPFTWTPDSTGTYTIFANASLVEHEIYPDDNTFIDGEVNVISVTGPVAVFTYSPAAPIEGETVTFNATDSYDQSINGSIVSYKWDFGDGVTGIYVGANLTYMATHTYTKAKEYNVTLRVTDDSEESDYSPPEVITVRGYPEAAFVYSPEEPLLNQTVTFDASASKPNGGTADYITRFEWDFGDGVTEIYVGANLTYMATHTYLNVGTYTVNLTISDNEGLSDSVIDTLEVITKHDVAVVNVYYVHPMIMGPLYAGWEIDVHVTAKNEGTAKETFEVTAFYDNTQIGTQGVTDLDPLEEEPVTFTWNTTGLSAGNYTIKAEASVVEGETEADRADNVLIYEDTITLHIRDLAVRNITVSPTIVAHGDLVIVDITVVNEGTWKDTCALKAYCSNATDKIKIDTASITLSSGANMTKSFTWNTSSVSPGVYNISAEAEVTSMLTETDIDPYDNIKHFDGTLTITRFKISISISASPKNITLGSSTTISGTLSPARVGVNVTIQYRLKGNETWSTLTTVTTDEDSEYSYSWKPEAIGTYEVKARWEGDENTAPADSPLETINVQEAKGGLIPVHVVAIAAGVAVVIVLAIAIYFLRIKKQKLA